MTWMTWSLASNLDRATPISYSNYGNYKKSSTPWTKHCTWPLSISIWKWICVPRRVIWCALRKLGIQHWLCGSYRACMNIPEADCVLVVTWPKCSVWKWMFTKALYADDLAIISESLEKLQEMLITGRIDMEGKGHRVNMDKTKVVISGLALDVL